MRNLTLACAKIPVVRQVARASPQLVQHIRALVAEEIIQALIAGAGPDVLGPMARLVADCDKRLDRIADARVEADEPTVGRRQRIAAEALTPALDHRGPRSARSSTKRTSTPGAAPKIARAR
jgi:hypothetical protein